MSRTIIKAGIGNAITSMAPDHIAAVANDIFDENLQKYQSEINQINLSSIYDVSAANAEGGEYATYDNLHSAIVAIDDDSRWDGITIRYINATTELYEQYRYVGRYTGSEDDDEFESIKNWECDGASTSYIVCQTPNSSNVKDIQVPGYILKTGGNIKVKFRNDNSNLENFSDVVNLRINNSAETPATAYPIIYNGAAATKTNSWKANEIVEFYFDGTNFVGRNAGVDKTPTEGSTKMVESGGVEQSMLFHRHNYSELEKTVCRDNIGFTNIQTKSHSNTDDIVIEDNSNNTVVKVNKNGLFAQKLFYGDNEQDLEEKINGLEEAINDLPDPQHIQSPVYIKDDNEQNIVLVEATEEHEDKVLIKDNNDNIVISIDDNGLYAKNIFFGTNNQNLEEKIEEIEEELHNTKDVALIVFMGQSNMAGRGVVSTLYPEDAPQVINGAGYEFRAFSDPTKLYEITKTFGNTEDNPDGIDDRGRKTGGMVPSFVNTFFKVTNIPVIGVSASVGGTSIISWQPDTPKLNDTIVRLRAAISYLQSNNYNICAKYVVWCQGEADGDIGRRPSDYANYFDTFANTLFNEGIQKIFVVRIGKYNGDDVNISYDDIINEQNSLCKNNENYIMATTVFAAFKDRGLMKDQFHYYQKGYNIAGNYAGLHVGNYLLYKKTDPMYDVMSNSLYFDSKTY